MLSVIRSVVPLDERVKVVHKYEKVMIYMFTLHVILSHALEATSSITERSSVILSVSEESVTDASLRSA